MNCYESLESAGRTKDTEKHRTDLMKNKYNINVISLILAVINIYLVVSLESWPKAVGGTVKVLFAVIGLLVHYALNVSFLIRREKRLRVHSLVWGMFMASSYVLGWRMERDATALAGLKNLPGLLVQIVCLTIPAAGCVAFLLDGRVRYVAADQRRKGCGIEEAKKKYQPWKVWLFYSAVIFICWLPVFLAYYPSVFAYDAEGQLYQVIAKDYSTHHPLLHTLFLGAFFRMGGGLLHSYSTGMAVHSVAQMMIMAAVFGYTLSYMYRKGTPVYLRVVLALFYALFPTNSILAISTTKDVLFAAFVLLYTLSLYGYVTGLERRADGCGRSVEAAVAGQEAGSRFGGKSGILYVVWAVLLMLFRNNAVYAMILSIPCVCLLLCREKGKKSRAWKQYLFCTAAALLLFSAGGMALKAVTGAHNGSPREMLSIPLQQMARTRVVAEDTLSDEMRQELDRYLPSEWVMAAYDPHLADPVKNRAVIHDDPVGLMKTWIKLGIQHPQIYIDAFLDNSIGYWFVQDRSHAQVYGIGTESGFGYLSTDNRTMPAGCEIVEHSYLPRLRAGMERIVSDNVYQNLPVIRLVFAPAFYWWMLCMYIAAAAYRRRRELLIPVFFLLFYYMTLLLSPTVLIRYMYPFVVTVPAICGCLSVDLKNYEGKNIQ